MEIFESFSQTIANVDPYAEYTQLYVSSAASGGGDGSLGDPYTIAEAFTNAASSTCMNFLAGTYNLAANHTLAASGSSTTALIVFRNAEGQAVTIDGGGTYRFLFATGRTNFVIDGFYFYDCYGGAEMGGAVQIEAAPNGGLIRIDNNHFEHCWALDNGCGLGIRTSGGDVYIYNNRIHDCGTDAGIGEAVHNFEANSTGITVFGDATRTGNYYVYNNWFYDIVGVCFKIKHAWDTGTPTVYVRYNFMLHGTVQGILSLAQDNCVVEYNVFAQNRHSSTDGGVQLFSDATTGENLTINHNTFYDVALAYLHMPADSEGDPFSTGTNTFKNNICSVVEYAYWINDTGDISYMDADYNCFHDISAGATAYFCRYGAAGSDYTITDLRALSPAFETNGMEDDPLYANEPSSLIGNEEYPITTAQPLVGDFALGGSSPCNNAADDATNIGAMGNGFDIGNIANWRAA